MANQLYKPRPERWPQFSLRGLLVVVTLAALLMPWAMAEYRAWRASRQRAPVPWTGWPKGGSTVHVYGGAVRPVPDDIDAETYLWLIKRDAEQREKAAKASQPPQESSD